jgi:predicted metal-binding membrane protein
MSDSAIESVFRRDRAVVVAALAAITALAWGYTVWLANGMDMAGMEMAGTGMGGGAAAPAMPGMKSGIGAGMGAAIAPGLRPWAPADFAFMLAMWVAMMVGMMTPSAAPMILIYARVGRQAAGQGKPLAATGWFAGGYLLAWAMFSLAATAGQWGLERVALLTPAMAGASRGFGGIVLIAAGLYQWTPWKDACLKHCQAPLMFIQRHGGFRRDASGSLAIGFRHGLYCVGCCWALMALLFVGGVMNVLWIAAIAIFVLAEKLAPGGRLLTRIAGAGFVAAGLWLLLLPAAT